MIPAGGTALCLVTGERLPPHATAAGKVLLAHGLLAAPAAAERYTPRTLTAPGPLAAHLARARATGLAEAHEEHRLGELSSRPRCSGPLPRGSRLSDRPDDRPLRPPRPGRAPDGGDGEPCAGRARVTEAVVVGQSKALKRTPPSVVRW
ncbi:IclR family transcriptional regulator C-terminal domain-containing protein [Streptomyces nogalater]